VKEAKEIEMRVLQIVTVLSTVFSATTAQAQSVAPCDLPHAPGVSTEQLTSGQRQRSYRLFVPPGYDGHQRLPLVLDLHAAAAMPRVKHGTAASRH
jgi:poly(3-hydroxybutyrate) depolymerase